MYAAGPRVSELAHLKVGDIDSARNVIWIRGGKGHKDRQTLLPPKLLELLRSYWRWKRPTAWLFPGRKPGQPICGPSIFRLCQKAAQAAGITKAFHPHSPRHAFATHLLEAGVNLFPAEPKLGPVYQRVTHLIPPDFPLMLIAPAVVMDWLRRRLDGRNRWLQSAAAGAAFLAAFVAVQWPLANFLMSPASRNWFFGTHYCPFFVPSSFDWVRNVFTQVEQSASEFWFKMALAVMIAILKSRMGLAMGGWMARPKR